MNPFIKDIFREISNSKGRFASICIITILGALMVVGIRASAVNMRDAAHNAFTQGNVYDLQVRSLVGFTEEDVIRIQNRLDVYRAVPTQIIDVYFEARDILRAMRIYSLPSGINELTLIEGRLPESYNEIAAERRFLRESGYSIGDTISFHNMDMPRFAGIFHTNEFIITGIAESPLYITSERGNTSLGAGTIRFYGFLHPDAFKLGIYTDIFVLMNESRNMHQVSLEYNEAANRWRDSIQEYMGGFVLTRQNGIAFESYFQDSLRLDQIGYVFPLIFFLVAILVTLTGISRMIEEQRGQIGIYKALGYKTPAILLKYIVYAFLCGAIGGVLGTVLGSQIIPRIIFDAYGHLYNMPYSNHPIPWDIGLITIGISIGCIVITALLTCINTLRAEPSVLMRPKAPKAGKRVLLEYVPLIWKRLGFISKVTSRNVFRYKRRFLMSIAGVAGCTALVLVAFGLSDSIGSVSRLQYEELVLYDYQIHMQDISDEERHLLLRDVHGEYLFIRSGTATAFTNLGSMPASLIIPENFNELSSFVRLAAPSRGFLGRIGEDTVADGEGVFITEKLARELGIRVGDYFTIIPGGDNPYTVRAAGIVENFVMHFIYMPLEYYQSVFGRTPAMNGLFVNGRINTWYIRDLNFVHATVSSASMLASLSGQTDALGVVTVVILVMACILAFVVLYNLTEINIIERMREIATIKVLGFYDTETAFYLYRENIVVTLLGTAVGLVAGIFLTGFVLSTAEIDLLKFPHVIFPVSFLFSAGISIFFALCVNAVTYRRLISIDMVSALKSVE